MFVLVALTIITVVACISQWLAFRRMCVYVDESLRAGLPAFRPKLAVILPCKGLDPGFRDNVSRLLSQEYHVGGAAHFEVVFTVASSDDPAYPVLEELIASCAPVPAKLVVAGVNTIRAQKINNQLHALEEISEDVEAIAFVDSDVIARPDFLRHLVGGLEAQDVGATTGYRFYIPTKADGPSVIRALWNRLSAWELASPRYSFAWGGAMAIKRSVFEKCGVARHWDRAADDDLSLTTAVKEAGLKVRFIPQCLVASHGDASLAEIVEWTNRQLILTKVYYPRLWRVAIAKATVMAFWLVLMLVSIAGMVAGADRVYLYSTLAGLAVIPVELYFLVAGQALWQRVLVDRSQQISSLLLQFILAVPLAHLALPWMTLYSVLTNRIQWRGVTYELRSPTETVVVQSA